MLEENISFDKGSCGGEIAVMHVHYNHCAVSGARREELRGGGIEAAMLNGLQILFFRY